MSDEVSCPYCNSKDLSRVPAPVGENPGSTSIIYKCQMCTRTFSKTPTTETEEK